MDIREYMKDHLLFLDGGMGTLLQKQGLAAGELPEMWNLTHPEQITAVHAQYFAAGSHVVSTNTFGANCLKFSEDTLETIIAAAVKNARDAATLCADSGEKWIALDIGPTGRMLEPNGDLSFEDAVEIFARTVRLGVRYGADLIFIETMNDSLETKAALLAAKENSNLPVFVSNAYNNDGRLLSGTSPAAMVAMLEGMGADAIGVNCSFGPQMLADVVREYLVHASVPVLMKPNAGLPSVVHGETTFDIDPEPFGTDVAQLMREGVRIAGGCCGTTPAYIAALTAAASDLKPVPVTDKLETCVSSYTDAVFFGDIPLLIGERINPTGKKKLKEALRAGDMDYIYTEAIGQKEKGVHILDVNVGLPEIDEPQMLCKAVRGIQSVVDLPLQIDTSDPTAMEHALRCYNGKALINSVSGKQESMDSIFPLAQKYGGVIIALTLDEDGIPQTAEGRVAIARRILTEAEKYGIARKNIVFDPLALTISAGDKAAVETLRAVETIRHEMGCHTSLGVSNVSFGLPLRDGINSTFFTMAMARGLSAAIMNPYALEMMKAYRGYLALTGWDKNCSDYIAFAETIPAPSASAPLSAPAKTGEEESLPPLQSAICKGLVGKAEDLCRDMLVSCSPMELVEKEIIPALNRVGDAFEKKKIYLPQLLMSANAAQKAFGIVKEAMPSHDRGVKCPFVLATVQGDVHDIGKNIVKLLLENYGFSVADLGKDVPPEVVVQKVVELHAPLVGLSALMTTTVPAMEKTIALIREAAPWAKIVVGGAVLNAEYAAAVGADAYAADAMETVRYAEKIWASVENT